MPSAPRNLTASSVTGNSITVSWLPPEGLGNTSVNYTVAVNAPNVVDQTVEALSAVISGLDPGTTYSISVTARNSVGSSGAVTIVVTTLDRESICLQRLITYLYKSFVTMYMYIGVSQFKTDCKSCACFLSLVIFWLAI